MVRLHGRGREIECLAERLRMTAAGRGQTAFLEGEAGIGKTRLVADTVALAEAGGFQVSQGRGEELEETRPFGVVADALGCERRCSDPVRAEIGRLICGEVASDHGAVTGPGLRSRVVEGLVELVEDLSLAQPVLLVLEDLHWADPSTLLSVRVLGRRLRHVPVMLIGTFRPTPRRGELARLVDACVEEGGLHLRLEPLDSSTVAGLVNDVLGTFPEGTSSGGTSPEVTLGRRLSQQLAGAGGNPLFVLELVSTLRDAGAIHVTSGIAEVDEVRLPPTLRLTILRRLSGLSDATLQLLRLASILGSSLSLGDLATICRRPVVELLPAVGEALQAGLLGEAGAQLAFRHELVREAVYHDLPHAVRVGLHREAGHALAAAGAPATQVAAHMRLGATPGDAEAVAWLCRAARQVAPRAPGVAADLFARAAELMDAADPARDAVVAEQIYSLMWSGRIGEGRRLSRQLLDRCQDPAVRVPLRIALSWALAMQGNLQDAVRTSEEEPDVSALSDRERVQLQAFNALGRATRGDLATAQIAAAAMAEAEALQDDIAWCAAGTALSLAAMLEGRLTDAIAMATEVTDRAKGHPLSEMQQMLCCYVLTECLTMADRLEEAAEVLNRGRHSSHERGSVWNLPLLHYAAGMRCFIAGAWDDAVTEVEAGLAVATETGTPLGAVGAYSLLALLAVHRGQPAAAKDHLAAADREFASIGPHPRAYWNAWVRGLLREAARRPEEALACLEQAWAEATAVGAANGYPLIGPDLVRLALAAGGRDRAWVVTEAVESAAARMGTASALGAALRCRGMIEADPQALLRAVICCRDAPRPFELARTCEDAGVLVSRAGGQDQARLLFDEALQVYERLGASHHIARVQGSAPPKKARRRARDRAAVGWDALTETELRVAALVAQGLTNSEVGKRLRISHHTVATHLAHIFVKLDVSSRQELAAHVARRTG